MAKDFRVRLTRVASALQTLAEEIGLIADEEPVSVDNYKATSERSKLSFEEYLMRFPNTAEPARIIIANPKYTDKEILAICNTRPKTIHGLLGYFYPAFTVIRDSKLDGHEFAARWLSEAPPRRRRGRGETVGAAIARLVLQHPTATTADLAEMCAERKIRAERKTIDGTRRYTHLAWRFAQARSGGEIPEPERGRATRILRWLSDHPLPAGAQRSAEEIDADIEAERRSWD